MQKNSGGGEDLIRGGDIFYLGGCTPPCTPPENPPMAEGVLRKNCCHSTCVGSNITHFFYKEFGIFMVSQM